MKQSLLGKMQIKYNAAGRHEPIEMNQLRSLKQIKILIALSTLDIIHYPNFNLHWKNRFRKNYRNKEIWRRQSICFFFKEWRKNELPFCMKKKKKIKNVFCEEFVFLRIHFLKTFIWYFFCWAYSRKIQISRKGALYFPRHTKDSQRSWLHCLQTQ